MSNPPHRRGFVLLMALALIAVASISLAGLARHSLRLAREATQAQEDLQRRWGILSCQRRLLEVADDLLELQAQAGAEPRRGGPAPSVVMGEFTLGGLQFTVRLADESAKANLNAIRERRPEGAARVAQAALAGASVSGVGGQVILWTSETPADEDRLVGWGQVFELTGPRAAQAGHQWIEQATRDITIWGGGRLNLRRASDTAVAFACESALPEPTVRKLLELRRAGQWTSLEELLRRLGLPGRELGRWRRLLTDSSDCHSLWVTTTSRSRRSTSLTVDRPGPGLSVDRLVLHW
jgi:hypothetical protein